MSVFVSLAVAASAVLGLALLLGVMVAAITVADSLRATRRAGREEARRAAVVMRGLRARQQLDQAAFQIARAMAAGATRHTPPTQ